MEMSNGEIRRSWETAADKKKQIQILAELNCTSVENIRSILIAEGIDQRRLPRNRQKTESSEAPDLDDVLDSETENTTDEVMTAIATTRERLPGVVKLYIRPTVEPRRDYERRRLVELFEAIITTERAGEEVELDWVTEFNSRWVEYVTEHYMEAIAE